MNKKVIVSLAVIGIVAAVAIGATIAYFSDTETSANNIFTAGTIDLSIDHKYQTYNGIDCHTCDINLVSDTTNMVVSKNGQPVTTPWNAKAVAQPYNIRWTAQNDSKFAGTGATWIWAHEPILPEDVTNTVTYTFQKEFIWDGDFTGAEVSFSAGSDNNVLAYVNTCLVGSHTTDTGTPEGQYAYQTPKTFTVPAECINKGGANNVLKFEVTNVGQASGNPGGLLYVFKIDGNCSENYQLGSHCNLWNEKELTSADKFWTFDDIKPGDWGTDLISLHVKSNDAKVCSYLTNATGILGDGINVFAWADDGDGIYDNGENEIYKGPISGFTGKMYDSTIAGNSTAYMGIAWCAGSVEGAQAVAVDHLNSAGTCSPVTMGNEYQGKTFSSDFGFYAVQERHNSEYKCPGTMPTE